MVLSTTTKIVMGRPKDGEDSSVSGSFAEKINDITDGTTTIQGFSIARKGSLIIAAIVYT
jgi:hypothetical protein